MAEGGGGVIYKADLFAPDFINRFGKGQVVVKVLKRTLFHFHSLKICAI